MLNNRIGIAVALLTVLFGAFSLATKPGWPLVEETEHEMHMVNEYPKVGEEFEVVYRVRLKPEIRPEFGNRKFFVKFGTGSSYKAEVLDTHEIVIPVLRPGEWQELRGRFRIPKPHKMVFVKARISNFSGKYAHAGGGLRLYLVDSLTGQYGTKEEFEKQLRQRAEWWYDPAGEFTDDRVSPACAEKNRKIIARIHDIDPALSDWDALYLHYDGIKTLKGGMGTRETTAEERWRFLLKMGWLEYHRQGQQVKEEWLGNMIERYQGKSLTKGRSLNSVFIIAILAVLIVIVVVIVQKKRGPAPYGKSCDY